MSCLNCGSKVGENLRLQNVKANPKVRAGENYEISFEVKNIHWLIFIYGRACLYEGNSVIANSGSFKISKGDTLEVKFTGRMPNNPLDLKVSIVAEAAGYIEKCEDSIELYIDIAAPGEDTEPPEDVEDEDKPLWYEDILNWLEENTFIVMGFVVLLAIALIMRRK